MKAKAIILHAPGTNRDYDAQRALELAGAEAQIVNMLELKEDTKKMTSYQMLVLPGGFSYADALGAGKFFAYNLLKYLYDDINTFVQSGKPVIGICNGFQVLVKAGILPGNFESAALNRDGYKTANATLTFNASGHFECRYVNLAPKSKKCLWTKNLTSGIHCPMAHGEGRFFTDDALASTLKANDQIALVYTTEDGTSAHGVYPANPNGSMLDIAGICNKEGNVLGLMPHPENNVVLRKRTNARIQAETKAALALWQAGVDAVK